LNAVVNGPGALVHLTRDDAATAEREAKDTLAAWPGTGFEQPHYWHMLAVTYIRLYSGESKRLHDAIEKDWPRLRRAGHLHSPVAGGFALQARSGACLARATATAKGHERDMLLRAAERHARSVAHRDVVGFAECAMLLEAGVAKVRGDDSLALERLATALDGFERAEMSFFAAATKHRLGTLRGGDDGKALAAEAVSFLTGEGVAKPRQFLAIVSPGFVD